MLRILSIPLLILFTSFVLHAQTDSVHRSPADSLLAYFDSLDLDDFTDGPVAQLRQRLPAPYSSQQLMPVDEREFQGVLLILYPHSIVVEIYVTAFRYTNPYGMSKKRNLRRFDKETVAAVRVLDGSGCVQGCD